jgi:hypothetical protein
VRENIEPLVDLGYIGKLSGHRGATFRYLLIDDGSADPEFCFNSEETPSTKNQGLNPKTSRVRTDFARTSHTA